MRLLVHDLPADFFSGEADGFTVVAAGEKALPCQGCFRCWTENPGYCVYADAYQHGGAAVGGSERVAVVSRLYCGGFSPAVKRFFDRSISDSLPFLTYRRGRTYHLRRYGTRPELALYFYGGRPDEQETARAYAAALAVNLDAASCRVTFAPDAGAYRGCAL